MNSYKADNIEVLKSVEELNKVIEKDPNCYFSICYRDVTTGGRRVSLSTDVFENMAHIPNRIFDSFLNRNNQYWERIKDKHGGEYDYLYIRAK